MYRSSYIVTESFCFVLFCLVSYQCEIYWVKKLDITRIPVGVRVAGRDITQVQKSRKGMCPHIPNPDNFPVGYAWVPLVMQPGALWVVYLASRVDSTSEIWGKSVLGIE